MTTAQPFAPAAPHRPRSRGRGGSHEPVAVRPDRSERATDRAGRRPAALPGQRRLHRADRRRAVRLGQHRPHPDPPGAAQARRLDPERARTSPDGLSTCAELRDDTFGCQAKRTAGSVDTLSASLAGRATESRSRFVVRPPGEAPSPGVAATAVAPGGDQRVRDLTVRPPGGLRSLDRPTARPREPARGGSGGAHRRAGADGSPTAAHRASGCSSSTIIRWCAPP